MTEHVEDIVVIPEKSQNYLNERQLLDYRSHREQLIRWTLTLGKNPEKAEGYAHETARARSYRLDRFYRWVWQNQTDGYTLEITTDHANKYLKYLAYQEHSKTFKASCQKAIKMLFKWQNFQQGKEIDWEPVINFNQYNGTSQPRDFLTREERRKLREASLEHGSVPHYNSVTPEERDKWKAHLAQRFGKPKEEIGMDDWKRANSWKEPSIIWTAMDAGLRPIEVGRARVSWVDLENGLLRIPREDSSKNTENWTVSLLERTTTSSKNGSKKENNTRNTTIQTNSGSHATTTPTAPSHSTTSSKESAKPPTSPKKTETSPGTQYGTRSAPTWPEKKASPPPKHKSATNQNKPR